MSSVRAERGRGFGGSEHSEIETQSPRRSFCWSDKVFNRRLSPIGTESSKLSDERNNSQDRTKHSYRYVRGFSKMRTKHIHYLQIDIINYQVKAGGYASIVEREGGYVLLHTLGL